MNRTQETKSDEEIAKQVQSGDTHAFGILFDRYEAKILRYGRKFLSNYEDIEDVVQEVFIKAYVHIKSFNSSRKFSTWLYRIAHNTFINLIKKNKREPLKFFEFDTIFNYPMKDSFSIEKEIERKELADTIKEHLDKIDIKYREAIILYYFEEKDYKEIADIMHIPISTAATRLKRGKEKLKEFYK